MKHIALGFLGFTGFVIFVFIPNLMLVWFYENAPVEYNSRTILTKEVVKGEYLLVEVISQVRKSACQARVYRSIILPSGTIVQFEPETRKASPQFIVKLRVPESAITGVAKYSVRVEWRCNPLQEMFPNVIEQQDLFFNIVEKKT